MGGPGSGNSSPYWRFNKKTAVEDCVTIDANHLKRDGVLEANGCGFGVESWTRRDGSSLQVSFDGDAQDLACPVLRLRYSYFWKHTQKYESADYNVPMTTTLPRFGGLRWWFLCPLIADEQRCERRVGKLHLPPWARYFGCRHCYMLTYRSVQAHDKRVDALRRNPEKMDAILHHPTGVSPAQLGVVWKARHAKPLRRKIGHE